MINFARCSNPKKIGGNDFGIESQSPSSVKNIRRCFCFINLGLENKTQQIINKTLSAECCFKIEGKNKYDFLELELYL